MNQNYVGFGRRLVATFLDGLILFVINLVIGIIVKMMTGSASTSSSMDPIAFTLSLLVNIAYFVVYQQKMGQTIGKKVLGIKVVDAQGQTPSLITFFLREIIGKFVDALTLGIGYLMIIWDGKKQGLHDKIAGTYVVKV